MGKGISKPVGAHEPQPVSLSELIHQHVRVAIETAVHEELRAALGTIPYERSEVRRGYRNGTKARTLTGPTGPVALMLPRATLFGPAREKEWKSAILPRYQRRMPEVNEAVAATYLAGGNTRRIRGALQPLLKAAPLSKSAVSRVIATLKDGLEAWRTRSLADLDIIYVYLDGFALRVRSAGKVVGLPVLGVVGVLPDGHKQLLALELCGGESFAAWKGCLDDLVARGLRAPVLVIIDGNAGLRRAVGLAWTKIAIQRCCVHKLRNLARKAPKHALAEIRDDFHRIVYAANADAARAAYAAFERTWAKRCPGVVMSLREGGDELLTFFTFPKAQWKTLRTTNTIERLHEEFRRRVKTQGSLPSEELLGPEKWTYFYLYVMLDVFSRYVVGWMVAHRESATLAERFIHETCTRQGIGRAQLTIHADRGSAMTSKPVALLLADLGVTKTHSRPRVSNDNPFSEAQFKTLKYRPAFPDRFGSIQDARAHGQDFFAWYNEDHHHSGLGLLTPHDVHFGLAAQRVAERAAVLTSAYAAHPERFPAGCPMPAAAPTEVWINPPKSALAAQTSSAAATSPLAHAAAFA